MSTAKPRKSVGTLSAENDLLRQGIGVAAGALDEFSANNRERLAFWALKDVLEGRAPRSELDAALMSPVAPLPPPRPAEWPVCPECGGRHAETKPGRCSGTYDGKHKPPASTHPVQVKATFG